ncbi:MAG: hypothetical protein Q7T52_19965, partial [Nocardioides sp.]|nr:hypothetical protein [Nocardioides sp.]
ADRWARAERVVFGPVSELLAAADGTPAAEVVRGVARLLDDGATGDLGPDQLVHADLAGNVLIDGSGAPLVIDVAPCWRPVRWAEAVCVLDSVRSLGTPPDVLGAWTSGVPQQAMLRAIAFRALSDPAGSPGYDDVLPVVAST